VAAAKATVDKTRPSASRRGYDNRWHKARVTFLAKHPRCAWCGAAARHVHHSTPHRGDSAIFWDTSRWVALCARCHNSVAQSAEKRAADIKAFPFPPKKGSTVIKGRDG